MRNRAYGALLTGAMLLLLGGCTDENPALSPAETVAPQPVPWAGVAVVDENTVVVRWRPSPSEGSQGFRSYYLVLQNMSRQAVVQRLEVTERRPLYELRFPRLNTGELYSLDIWVRFKDNVLSPAPRTLVFSPSVRYREIAGEPIRLYEQDAGAGLPKGFAFNRGGAPAVLPAASPGMIELWDLNFEIVDGVGYLGSTAATAVYAEDDSATAAQRNKAWRQRLQRAARVGENVLLDVESLETLFLEAGLDTVGGRLERRMVRIPDRLPSGKGLVLIAWSARDSTWAKVFVKPGPGGELIQGTAPNRYVELEFAYQPSKMVPYALPRRAEAERRGWNMLPALQPVVR
jgi:hypothetical protein